PAYANGFLYGTCWFCPLYTIDTADGSIADQDSLVSSSGSTSFPAVSDGWVWLEDNDGNIFGFLGQLPVGVLLKPSSQAQDSVPDNTVTYSVNVKNVGISGPDTFDATITAGAHGWAVGLYESDGVTPLPDTDSDGIPDTGSLATGASADVVIKVTVPVTVSPGDTELSKATFTSSNDLSRFKAEKLTTTVPLPGVSIEQRAYFPLQPGDTAAAPMDVRNKGGPPEQGMAAVPPRPRARSREPRALPRTDDPAMDHVGRRRVADPVDRLHHRRALGLRDLAGRRD